jgi:PAS domain S-box-containing protein
LADLQTWCICQTGPALQCMGNNKQIRSSSASTAEVQLFDSAFRFAAIGMGLVGLDGRWLRVNRSLCDLVGYSEAELLATTFQAITHPEDLGTDLAQVGALVAREISNYHLEKRYIHKQGHIVWVLLSVSLVMTANDDPLYFIAQVQDITARKKAETELRQVNAELRAALAEVEELRGILPICSYCKKVRDEHDYWQQIEAYIEKHSDAKFSHAICPQCLPKVEAEFDGFGEQSQPRPDDLRRDSPERS